MGTAEAATAAEERDKFLWSGHSPGRWKQQQLRLQLRIPQQQPPNNNYPNNNYPNNNYPNNNYPNNNNNNFQQQQCQCNYNLTFKDRYGNTHGACRRADETGRTWCYTYGGCPDSRQSSRFPNNPWSYQACQYSG